MGILETLVKQTESINDFIGRVVSWTILGVVLITFLVAILRYVFSMGWIQLQESYMWLHGILFTSAMGYAFLHDSHVRVDIFYRAASTRYKAWVNLVGTIIFLFPTLGMIWWTCYPYVIISWQRLETSMEAGGLPALYLLKSFLLVLVAVLLLQGIAVISRCILVLRGTTKYAEPFDSSQVV